jgi:hypothetical protein
MRTFKALLASLLTLSISTTSISAAPFSPVMNNSEFKISLPASMGYISETYRTDARAKAPDVILIQNLHTNRSVQFAISGILKKLAAQGLMPDHIAMEGAVGPVDMKEMQREADVALRKKAADYLVDQGEMPGAMHYAVTAGKGGLFGIETDEYYQANLEMFRQSYAGRERLHQELNVLEEAVSQLKTDKNQAAQIKADLAAVKQLVEQSVIPEELPGVLARAAGAVENLKDVVQDADVLAPASAAINFYSLALLRDEQLFKNTLAVRQLGRQKTTIVVTGGFHTEALAKQFKARGFSYAVITPNVKRHTVADQQLYIERLMGNHLTLEQIANGYRWDAQVMIEPSFDGEVQPRWRPTTTALRGALVTGALAAALLGDAPRQPNQTQLTPMPAVNVAIGGQPKTADVQRVPNEIREKYVAQAPEQDAPRQLGPISKTFGYLLVFSGLIGASIARSRFSRLRFVAATATLFFIFSGMNAVQAQVAVVQQATQGAIARHAIPLIMMPGAEQRGQAAPRTFHTIKEWAQFVLDQRLRSRGLPLTFDIPAGTKMGDPDADIIVQRGALLYDTAIAIGALTDAGLYADAKGIIQHYENARRGISYGVMDLRAWPNQTNQYIPFKPFSEALNYFFDISPADGIFRPTIGKDWSYWTAHTGPNAWMLNRIVHYMERSGDKSFIPLARHLGDSMALLQDPAAQGGIRYGPHGNFNPAKRDDPDFDFNRVNSENMDSAYSALNRLAALTGDKKYTDMAVRALHWFVDGDFYNPSTGQMQKGMMNPQTGLIYVDAMYNTKLKRWELATEHAEDSGGSWTISSLGPETIDKVWGTKEAPAAAYRMWHSVRNTMGWTADYRRPGADQPVSMMDFKGGYPSAQALGSPEWTGGAIKAVERLITHYTTGLGKGLLTDAQIAGLNADLAAMKKWLAEHSTNYAYGPGMEAPRNGETGWNWFSGRGATIVAGYALQAGDPLESRGVPTDIALPRPSPATTLGTPAPRQNAPAPAQQPAPSVQAAGRELAGQRSTWGSNPFVDIYRLEAPLTFRSGESVALQFDSDDVGQLIIVRFLKPGTPDGDKASYSGPNIATHEYKIPATGLVVVPQAHMGQGPWETIEVHSGNAWRTRSDSRAGIRWQVAPKLLPGGAAAQAAAAAPSAPQTRATPAPVQTPAPAPAPTPAPAAPSAAQGSQQEILFQRTLNQSYGGGTDSWLGYYSIVSPTEMSRSASGRTIEYRFRPAASAAQEFSGFHVDIKGSTGNAYSLYGTLENGTWRLWHTRNNFNNVNASVRVDGGTVIVSIPYSAVMAVIGAGRITEYHGQTGIQQNNEPLNKRNIPTSVEVRIYAGRIAVNMPPLKYDRVRRALLSVSMFVVGIVGAALALTIAGSVITGASDAMAMVSGPSIATSSVGIGWVVDLMGWLSVGLIGMMAARREHREEVQRRASRLRAALPNWGRSIRATSQSLVDLGARTLGKIRQIEVRQQASAMTNSVAKRAFGAAA